MAMSMLAPDQGVAGSNIGGITNISILGGGLSIATALGGMFDGSLTLALQWTGQDPALTLDNLAPTHGSPATITWPTATRPETQILTPGTPMVLSGIVGVERFFGDGAGIRSPNSHLPVSERASLP
jgi:hypothetical protein